MRDPKKGISDEMWALYLDRVIKPQDPRLQDPALPFARDDVCFIVHRHKIRIMRSLEEAQRKSAELEERLYILQARDEAVRREDQCKLTAPVVEDLLRRCNPEYTKGLPSFLPLYRGMRLLLSSKDCVRLGVVKGCPVVVRDIVLSEDEEIPFGLPAGRAHQLKYMPYSLLLQAEGVQWTLPREELPADLPPTVDRKGLFQLRPHQDYLRVHVGNEYISVRRTSFMASPADTITVYAAQGSTYDAVIADMQKPPNLGFAQHWLACYVMLSRARSLDGFLVLRPATREELSATPPQFLLDEIDRLAQLEESSLPELIAYIESLHLDVPEEIQSVLSKDAPQREIDMLSQRRPSTNSKSVLSRRDSAAGVSLQVESAGGSKRKIPSLKTPPVSVESPLKKRLRQKTTVFSGGHASSSPQLV